MSAQNNTPEVGRAVIYRGAKFDFEEVTLRGRDGKVLKRQMVRHPGAAVIVPILDAGPGGAGVQIVLIRNSRFAVGQRLWELPAGTLERGEDPMVCAGRELEEETGYRAATLTPLGRFYSSPGMSDEMMFAFTATGLTQVGQRLEADEQLTVHPVPLSEVWGMLDRGELIDGKTVASLALAERKGFFRGTNR